MGELFLPSERRMVRVISLTSVQEEVSSRAAADGAGLCRK